MEFIKPFFIGGGVVAGAKFLSTKIDPAYAPLLAETPTGILATFFLNNELEKKKYYTGYLVTDSVVPFSTLVIVLGFTFLKNYPINYLTSLGYLVWLILSFSIITYIKSIRQGELHSFA